MYRRLRRWRSGDRSRKLLFESEIFSAGETNRRKSHIFPHHALHPLTRCAMMQKEMRKTMTERVVYKISPREDGHRLEAVCESCIRRPLPSCARKDDSLSVTVQLTLQAFKVKQKVEPCIRTLGRKRLKVLFLF